MYELESAIVQELNDRSDEIIFSLSDRTRSSIAQRNKVGIIDFAKVMQVKGKEIIKIVLIKNFASGDFDWKSALSKLPNQIRAKLNDVPVGTRYSWTRGKYLDDHELTGDVQNQWGSTSGDSAPATALADALTKATIKGGNASNVAKLLSSGASDDDQMAYRFTTYVNAQPTVVFNKRIWRSVGLSEIMRQAGIRLVFPEAGSEVVALSLADFEQVALKGGWTVTQNENDAKLLHKVDKPFGGPTKSGAQTRREDMKAIEMRYKSRVSSDPNLAAVDKIIEEEGKVSAERIDLLLADDRLSESTRSLLKGAGNRTYLSNLEIAKTLRKNIVQRLAELREEEIATIQTGATSQDAGVAARKSRLEDNVKTITSKVIHIQPRDNYFIIKSVAGQTVPTI